MTVLRLALAAVAGATMTLTTAWALGLVGSRAAVTVSKPTPQPMVWTCVTGDRRYTTITTACAWVAIPPTPPTP